jgi:Glycosyl hydrolase family 26
MRKSSGIIISALLPLVILTAASFVLFPRTAAHHRHSGIPAHKHHAQKRYQRAISAGWISGVALDRYRDLGPWIAATGQKPDVIEIYAKLSDPFPTAEIETILNHGALPMIQLQPRHTPVTSIVRGDLDRHLSEWAAALHRLHAKVAISFAHEMNGDWYTWGCGDTPAYLYRMAWRHVHDIIGTSGVIWVWSVNKTWNGSCRMQPRYPGDRYVTWVGIDGYLRETNSTFNSVFARTLQKLRTFTGNKPILIAETGVPMRLNQPHQIRELYEGAAREGLLGVVYFNAATRKGDYRPQDNPAALRVFRDVEALSHQGEIWTK